jgi:preprotein translocase subunit SecY
LVLNPGFGFRMTAVVSLVAGTMFLMWLGEQITERGLGNGISIIIFGGIAAGLPSSSAVCSSWCAPVRAFWRQSSLFSLAAVTFSWCMSNVASARSGELCKRQVGNKVYGGQSSHLPLKLNMAGVIPPIFASSIILFPATVVNWFSAGESMRWLKDIASTLTLVSRSMSCCMLPRSFSSASSIRRWCSTAGKRPTT